MPCALRAELNQAGIAWSLRPSLAVPSQDGFVWGQPLSSLFPTTGLLPLQLEMSPIQGLLHLKCNSSRGGSHFKPGPVGPVVSYGFLLRPVSVQQIDELAVLRTGCFIC